MVQNSSLTPSDLDQLYDPPFEHVQKQVLPALTQFHRDYLARATFFCLATGRGTGLDASPRGGSAGFVKVLDATTLAFGDWPGNNRIESMRNLVEDDRVGMLFLWPGLDLFMRINGRGRVTDDADLRASLSEGKKIPKTAIVVTVSEVMFHCGKAVNRAKLWAPESRIGRGVLPTFGQMAAANAQKPELAQAVDDHLEKIYRESLYTYNHGFGAAESDNEH